MTATETTVRGEPLKFLQASLTIETDDCIEWPYGQNFGDRDGYGRVVFEGRTRTVTHVVLTLRGTPRPSRRHLALHSCDHPPCINGRHLRWGLHTENDADMCQRGRHVPRCVVSDEVAVRIRERYQLGGIAQAALGRAFGLSQSQVSRIVSGRSRAQLIGASS